MKGVCGKAVIIVSVLFTVCQLATCQIETRSLSGTSTNGNVTTKTGRAISSTNKGSNNRLPTDSATEEEEDGNNSDGAFDNSPVDRHSSEIIFREDDVHPTTLNSTPSTGVKPTVNQTNWKKIPLNALVRFGKESDVSNFLHKFVANAKLAQNVNTLEKILVDSDSGAPLLNSRNEKVIVTPAQPMRTIPPAFAIQTRGPTHGVPLHPSSRSGLEIPGRKSEADLSLTSRVRQTPHQKHRPVTFPECTPEKISVPVPVTGEPHLLFIPRCAKVERCGGCCLSDIMACEPDTKETVDFRVHKLGYIGEDKLEYIDDLVVQLDRHLSCSCKCKTKQEDCLPYHIYDESKCSCVCKNTNDYNDCQNNLNKVWDEDKCMCLCRETRPCSSGLEYDAISCECVAAPVDEISQRSNKPPVRGKGPKRGL